MQVLLIEEQMRGQIQEPMHATAAQTDGLIQQGATGVLMPPEMVELRTRRAVKPRGFEFRFFRGTQAQAACLFQRLLLMFHGLLQGTRL